MAKRAAPRESTAVPLRVSFDTPKPGTGGVRFRLVVHNDGPARTFAATAIRNSGRMPSEPPIELSWRGAELERTARIEQGKAERLRLAVARDADGPNRCFALLGVDEAGRVQRRNADDDVIELTIRIRECEADAVVLEQRVWLSYTMRDGEVIPIASTDPPESPALLAPAPRSYLGLEISDRNLRSTIPPHTDPLRSLTSQQRLSGWRDEYQFPAEYLLPHIDRHVTGTWPAPFMVERRHSDASTTTEDLRATVARLKPWALPFRLADGTNTMSMMFPDPQLKARRVMFRRDLITGTVEELLGAELASTTVLDIGCNNGFFSLDMAHRGARHVDGIDLRPENIAQAEFLAKHYGLDNVSFRVLDADALPTGEQWDVVLNLGVLYHVVNPLQFLEQTYGLCRRFAIIDTICHKEPISAFVLLGNKDASSAAEGREEWEFQPTYRGAIDAIRYAGFSDVVEVLGYGDVGHELYDDGGRRCFLAIK